MKPDSVINLKNKLKEKNIWHIITENIDGQVATSCRDAIQKRFRLGNEKIHIYSELKSSLEYAIVDDKIAYYIIHCKGNHTLDRDKIYKLLNKKLYRLEKEKLDKKFRLYKGLVNPFLAFYYPEIIQIFDKSIIEQKLIPYTMMTNASHPSWGIEFYPQDLIDSFENSIIADIVQDETKFNIKNNTIGILTGNSPESGILLWEMINSNIRRDFTDMFLGDISFPKVLVESVPEMGLSMELDKRFELVEKCVKESVESLCKRGATMVCIACNTTQYFSDELKQICSNYGAEYISMADNVANYLKENDIKEFDFLGINYVSDFEKWSAFKELNENFNVKIPPKKHIEKINNFAFKVKSSVVDEESINKLRDLISKSTKTNTVMLALTELSLVFFKQKTKKHKKIFVDTLSILAETISNRYTKEYVELHDREKDFIE